MEQSGVNVHMAVVINPPNTTTLKKFAIIVPQLTIKCTKLRGKTLRNTAMIRSVFGDLIFSMAFCVAVGGGGGGVNCG